MKNKLKTIKEAKDRQKIKVNKKYLIYLIIFTNLKLIFTYH